MTLKTFTAAAGLSLAASTASYAASVTFDVLEVGGNVVVQGAGAVDLTGLISQPGILAAGAGISALDSQIVVGASASTDAYVVSPSLLPDFGAGSFVSGSGSGDLLGFAGFLDGFIVLPDAYVSLTNLLGSATFSGQSFASLGLTEGSYSFSFGNNDWDVNIGPVAAVPLPAGGLLLLAGLGGIAALKRRKNGSA